MHVTITDYSKTIKHKPILRNVNAEFDYGHVYGIVGPNGSGKTMLLRAICGFIRPDSGSVAIEGRTVEFNRRLPEPVGVIIESPGFVLSESGEQNLRYLADINRCYDEEETRRLLTEFGLEVHLNEKVSSYSLGMRQKLGVVQALMEHQRLILLDEPTNGLDEASVTVFLQEMRHQKDLGNTVIIASHHSDELGQIADTLYTMDNGTLRREE